MIHGIRPFVPIAYHLMIHALFSHALFSLTFHLHKSIRKLRFLYSLSKPINLPLYLLEVRCEKELPEGADVLASAEGYVTSLEVAVFSFR